MSFWLGKKTLKCKNLVFKALLWTILKGLWVVILCGVRCYLPREWRQKYILHFLSDWTLRHPDCFLYNLNITAKMATCFVQFQLCGVLVLHWFRGRLRLARSRATESHSHCSMSSHYIWDQNVTVVSMVRQLKDMVNKCKTKLQRSWFSVLSDLYSLWIYFPLTPWN